MPTRLFMEAGHDITVFYANSNIAPKSEYDHRLAELKAYGTRSGFEVLEGVYDPQAWEEKVAPIGESLKEFSPALGEEVASHGDCDGYEGVGSVAELLDDERREARCRACYRMRLEEAAALAAEQGYEGLATTLAVSPYQFSRTCEEELERACETFGIEPLFEDYRPYYREATRISRELGMYRQNYCGCRYSIAEAEATRAFIRAQRKRAKRDQSA